MKYSIIITFYQNIKMLSSCVTSVIRSLKSLDAEILIINDNPEISLNSWKPEIPLTIPFKIISQKENGGHSVACNRGVQECNGEYIVLLDSDVIVTGSWLEELEKTYFGHNDCGSAVSTILDLEDNCIVYYGMYLHNVETIKPFQGSQRDKKYLLQDQESQIITAGSMMVKKELYLSLGGLKKEFYNSCNDLDFSMEVSQYGYKNYCSANSIVYHRGNISGPIRFSSHVYARSLFFQRWSQQILANDGLGILTTLYAEQRIESGDYLVLNLSSSLFSMDYLECLLSAHNITFFDVYQINTARGLPHISLMDFLSWGICEYRIPILYFTDNYRVISGNALWFKMRANKMDLVADVNGNLRHINPIQSL